MFWTNLSFYYPTKEQTLNDNSRQHSATDTRNTYFEKAVSSLEIN